MQDARRRQVSKFAIGVMLVALVVAGLEGCVRPRTQPFAEPALPQREPSPRPLEVAEAPPPPAETEFEQVSLGQSLLGQDLAMTIFRGGPESVLVIGGVHGNEPTSVDVAQGLLELLRRQPHLAQGRTVAIFPNANPDGYAARSRYNANQVDVNRNFAASNFKPSMQAGFRSGTTPNSEPETRAIVRAIEMTQPVLLISIHSISKGRECNNYDGPGEQVAQIMSQFNGYPPVATIGYPTPGSLGSYAGIDRQIPMITLELPRSLPGDQAWETNREALLAAIAAEQVMVGK